MINSIPSPYSSSFEIPSAIFTNLLQNGNNQLLNWYCEDVTISLFTMKLLPFIYFFLIPTFFLFLNTQCAKIQIILVLKKISFGRGKKACDRTVLVSYCCIKKCFVKNENNIIIVVDECSFFPILL